MKKLALVLQIVAVAFFAGSLLVGGAAFLVTFLTASQIGGEMPLFYFEKLNLPLLSIALPMAGIIVFLLALPGILGLRKVSEESNVVEFSAKPAEVTRRAENFSNHLKAA
ncbi:MAG: hypothetical protein SF097_04945 [Acidobacteriota bacterium]|nr:hypothetical protein [Acidobacteriota bacterium]